MRKIVLMCSHNGAKYIREQVISIVNQSSPVDLLTIFDFASTDDTRRVIDQLVEDYGTLRIDVRKYDQAPGAALSFFRAMEHILPDLQPNDCVFLSDQDDVWEPNKVEILHQRFRQIRQEKRAPLLLFHDVDIVDDALNVIRPSFYVNSPFRVPRDLDPRRLLFANPIVGHTIAMSPDLVALAVNLKERANYLMHDWACVLLASRFGQIAYQNEILSHYRQHSANVLGAHGRHGLNGIFARLTSLSQKVRIQAESFLSEIQDLQKRSPGCPAHDHWIDRQLLQSYRRSGWKWRYELAKCAALSGPTVKRKLLSGFLLASAKSARN